MWKFTAEKLDRLDRLLRGHQTPGSEWVGAAARDWLIENGFVRVKEKRVLKGGEKIAPGSAVEVKFPDGYTFPFVGGTKQFAPILFLEKEYGIFSKAVGIPTIPLRPWETDSFVHRALNTLEEKSLVSRLDFQALAQAPALEGGVVQRLDFYTSGLLCVAFTSSAKAAFRQLFSEKKLEKTYWCIVALTPAFAKTTNSFSVVFEQKEASPSKMQSKLVTEPNESSLSLKVLILKRNDSYALCEVTTQSGARHVVRSGMSAVGAPLWNDAVYGVQVNTDLGFQLHARQMRLHGDAALANFPSQLLAPAPDSFLESVKVLGLE